VLVSKVNKVIDYKQIMNNYEQKHKKIESILKRKISI